MTMLPDIGDDEYRQWQAQQFDDDAQRRIAALGFEHAANDRIASLPSSDALTNPLGPRPVSAGNIDLANRPVVRNPDNTVSTVRSMSFQDEQGNEVLVPTVSDDGRIMSNDEAIDQYYKTGKHLGIYSSPEGADIYARRLHEQQQERYAPTPPEPEPVPPSPPPAAPAQAPPWSPVTQALTRPGAISTFQAQPSPPPTEPRPNPLNDWLSQVLGNVEQAGGDVGTFLKNWG